VRKADTLCITGRLVEIELKILAGFKGYWPIGKGADAKLGPLKINKDRRRPPIFLFERTDVPDDFRTIRLGTVAHIDAEGIGPGLEELFDHFWRPAGGTKCGENTNPARARQNVSMV
jgi:hypothetical protein